MGQFQMFGKWVKRSKESKTKSSTSLPSSTDEKTSTEAETSTDAESSAVKSPSAVTIKVTLPSNKKCPACNTEYPDGNLVVCPKDATMLLRPVPPSNWYEWRETTRYCPKCKALYYDYLPQVCGRDGTKLEPFKDNPFSPPILQERFKLARFIERSEMFEEYEALDLDTDKPVRVKLLNRHLSQDQRTVSNLFKYARPALGLTHDRIITLISVNATDEGIPYLITDLVETRTLSEELGTRKFFTPSDAKKIFADFLSAIQCAHDHGIVHGGISMHNLFLHCGTDSLRGYVANFGIAERLFREMDWTGASTNTHTANVYGDPSTICPEFCVGTRPTPASDIYQIGCCLYQCLSGEIPFERDTMPMILIAHMSDPPDDIRKKKSEISPELAEIVYRCLSKEPAGRYPSALALSQALASEVTE